MDKLDNFSTRELLNELIFRIENDQNSIINYLSYYSAEELSRVKELLAPYIRLEQLVFLTNDYKNVPIDRVFLDKTDKEVMCSRLIYDNPIKPHSNFRDKEFGEISIFNAKHLLQTTTLSKNSGVIQNALVSQIDYFSHQDLIKVRNAINFYEEQVIRQAMEIEDLSINLFDLNKEEKSLIVEEEYSQIATYIVDNALICVWGDLNDTLKRKLYYSINGKGNANKMIKRRLINTIADYTTLSELQEGIVKTKTLDRFILKKSN